MMLRERLYKLLLSAATLILLAGCAGTVVTPRDSDYHPRVAHPRAPDAFAYRHEPVRPAELEGATREDAHYTRRTLAFDVPAQHDRAAVSITAHYYRGDAPGPRPLVIIVPVWGHGLYRWPSVMFSGYVRDASEGRFDILEIDGTGEPLVDWEALSAAPTPDAFVDRSEATVDRIKQTVVGIRRMVDWAATRDDINSHSVALAGFSMGSVVAAMALGADERFTAGALVMGGAELGTIFASCHGRVGSVREAVTARFDWSRDDYRRLFERLFRDGEPQRFSGFYDASELLMIDSMYDDCMPEETRDALWEALGRPRRVTFIADHRMAFLAMTPLGFNYGHRSIYTFFEDRLQDEGTRLVDTRGDLQQGTTTEQEARNRTVLRGSLKQQRMPALAAAATAVTLAAAPAAAAPEGNNRLEEVVVTAQKRSQSLQDVPISMMAFNQRELKVKGIRNIQDIHSKVPNLYVEPFPQNNSAMRVWIRGIVNKDVQITQDPAVGIYLDGVYIPRSTGSSMDVADIARIEVLRGPQGTLYGRNTTGGAINIITRRAELDSFRFRQELSAGSRDLVSARTFVNVPLTDELATKLALFTEQQDGFIDNAGPGGDYGDREVLAMRFDLQWHPIERLRLDYAYDRSELDTHNYTMQATERPFKFKGQAEPIKREAEAESQYSEDRFSTMATTKPLEESSTDIEGHAITVHTGFKTYDVKYIGAYREMRDISYADLGGGAGSPVYRVDNHEYTTNEGEYLPLVKPAVDHDQWSHEVQIHGQSFDERVEYFVGGYFFEESATYDNAPRHHQFSSPIDGESISSVFLPFAGSGIPVVDAVLGGAADASGARIVNVVSQFYEIDNRAWALFGQATWTPRFWDHRFHLTVGMRHSVDAREATKTATDQILLELDSSGTTDDITGIFPRTGGKNFDHVTGHNRFRDDSFEVIAEFDTTDNVRVYGKAVQAYKSGGFNVRDPQVDGNQGPASDGSNYGFGFREGFSEEKAISYELGIKSEAWDNRVRVNADVFYTIFRDQQRNDVIQGTIADTKVFNAGKSRLQGLEMNVTARALPNLFLVLNYGYLDAETVEAEDPFGNDISHEFPFVVARHTANVSANWIVTRGDWGTLNLYTGYDYVDDRDNHRKPELSIDAFGLMSARAGITDIPAGRRGTVDIAAWGRNLTDEEYVLTTISELPHANRAVLWGEPRSYGVDLTYHY